MPSCISLAQHQLVGWSAGSEPMAQESAGERASGGTGGWWWTGSPVWSPVLAEGLSVGAGVSQEQSRVPAGVYPCRNKRIPEMDKVLEWGHGESATAAQPSPAARPLTVGQLHSPAVPSTWDKNPHENTSFPFRSSPAHSYAFLQPVLILQSSLQSQPKAGRVSLDVPPAGLSPSHPPGGACLHSFMRTEPHS